MQISALPLVSIFAAVPGFAIPHPGPNTMAIMPLGLDDIVYYFSMLLNEFPTRLDGSPVRTCDTSKIIMPLASPTPLPPPSPGLTLKHVAIGRGTQNYTCDTTNSTAVPASIGAAATLFNATCMAASYPEQLNSLPKVTLDYFTLVEVLEHPTVSGRHFFPDTKTPFFNLDTPGMRLGEIRCSSNNSVPAPPDAPRGHDGEAAVNWLKLVAKNGTTGNLKEVYRLQTAGGQPPETCQGMPASFERQYAAEYVTIPAS